MQFDFIHIFSIRRFFIGIGTKIFFFVSLWVFMRTVLCSVFLYYLAISTYRHVHHGALSLFAYHLPWRARVITMSLSSRVSHYHVNVIHQSAQQISSTYLRRVLITCSMFDPSNIGRHETHGRCSNTLL